MCMIYTHERYLEILVVVRSVVALTYVNGTYI